jgi:hypothetical protein
MPAENQNPLRGQAIELFNAFDPMDINKEFAIILKSASLIQHCHEYLPRKFQLQ